MVEKGAIIETESVSCPAKIVVECDSGDRQKEENESLLQTGSSPVPKTMLPTLSEVKDKVDANLHDKITQLFRGKFNSVILIDGDKLI